jgi:hypothetical protein
MSGALATSLMLALAGPGDLEVTGDATCPAPAEVSRQLAELLPAGARGDVMAAARVVLTRSASALRLVLIGPNANELATRELKLEGSCDDLAIAAAVVVAAWRADLNPDLTLTVNLPDEEPRLPPPVKAPTRSIAVKSTRPPPRPLPFTVGLGLLASETGGAFAPGALVNGAVELTASGFGLDASLSGTTSRSADVGTFANAASWSRVTLAVGPSLTRGGQKVRFGAHAQVLAALLRVRGVALTNAGSDTTPELGASLGAKVELVAGTSAIWLGLDLCSWPGDQRLVISGVTEQGQLSRFEGTASLGLSIGRFP